MTLPLTPVDSLTVTCGTELELRSLNTSRLTSLPSGSWSTTLSNGTVKSDDCHCIDFQTDPILHWTLKVLSMAVAGISARASCANAATPAHRRKDGRTGARPGELVRSLKRDIITTVLNVWLIMQLLRGTWPEFASNDKRRGRGAYNSVRCRAGK